MKSELNYILIDGIKIQIKDWSYTIMQQCDLLNVAIPRFCYHDRLSIAGNCRICLIEVESSIKPVIACATGIVRGLSIKTNSVLVRKARENVMEFLLINHPLDCPICDQGGECDLQDLAMIYGGDRSRFKELKRSVEDKDFGPLVKTIMTRCIHCTRCIRFFDEIANVSYIGTMGRGNSTEISTYISTFFDSELVGNVVDVCPVGALTSKPYAFTARPWELNSIESIDIFDGLCGSIRLDVKGDNIMRILPKSNFLLNEDWITDKIRYSYDGFKLERLTYPMHKNKENALFEIHSWHYIYSIIKKYLDHTNIQNIIFYLGDFIDTYTLFLIHIFSNQFYKKQIFFFNKILKITNIDLRNYYLLDSSSSTFFNNENYLFIGCNFREDNPILNSRLNRKNNRMIYSIGHNASYYLDKLKHIGITINTVIQFLKGKKFLCNLFEKTQKNKIVVGSSSCMSNEYLLQYLSMLKFPLESGILVNNVTNLNLFESGVISLNFNKYKSQEDDFFYLVNYYQPVDNNAKKRFQIFQGHHGSLNAMNSDILLPSKTFVEESKPFFNFFGYPQWTNSALSGIGESKMNSTIINELIFYIFGNKIKKKFSIFLFYSLFPYISDDLYKYNNLLSDSLITSLRLFNNQFNFFLNRKLMLTEYNYFRNNIISYYSKNMYILNSNKKKLFVNNFFN